MVEQTEIDEYERWEDVGYITLHPERVGFMLVEYHGLVVGIVKIDELKNMSIGQVHSARIKMWPTMEDYE